MEIIIADYDGKEIQELMYPSFDVDTSDDKSTFAVSIPVLQWDRLPVYEYHGGIQYGMRIYVPETEYGGVVGEIYTDTEEQMITVYGYTWRGLLDKKIIMPANGSTHMVVSGDIGIILADLINNQFDGLIIANNSPIGVTVNNYVFDRFCTLLEGIRNMLYSVGYKLSIKYKQSRNGGNALVQAVPVVDYSKEIEISQDYQIDIAVDDVRNGVNHLIVGGKGELDSRYILHLYVQGDGSISTSNQYYFGRDEIVEFYDNTSTETEDLLNTSIDYLKDIKNRKMMDLNANSLGIDSVEIGDIIGGRDFITGTTQTAKIKGITLTIEDGHIYKKFELEEN